MLDLFFDKTAYAAFYIIYDSEIKKLRKRQNQAENDELVI